MCRPGDAYQLIVCRGFAAVLAASDLRQNRAPRTASRFRDLSVSIRTSRCRPGVTPQRPEYEGPAQQEQRGTDGEAVEGYSRLMAPRGVHLGVAQQRRCREWDRTEVSDIGPRRHGHRHSKDEVIDPPDHFGERSGPKRQAGQCPEASLRAALAPSRQEARHTGTESRECRNDVVEVANTVVVADVQN
jgi:hypothetical protein